jgi:hypothetical protein
MIRVTRFYEEVRSTVGDFPTIEEATEAAYQDACRERESAEKYGFETRLKITGAWRLNLEDVYTLKVLARKSSRQLAEYSWKLTDLSGEFSLASAGIP